MIMTENFLYTRIHYAPKTNFFRNNPYALNYAVFFRYVNGLKRFFLKTPIYDDQSAFNIIFISIFRSTAHLTFRFSIFLKEYLA